jgi:glycine hydroxymethyltransferase
MQGGPLLHVIAAKAVALKEARSDEFRRYQAQVLVNAKVMADGLNRRGFRIVSGGTQTHMFLVDLRAKKVTGKEAEEALGRARITVNKNAVPNDTERPAVTSGIRIGVPAITTRGFMESDAAHLADLVADVMESPNDMTVTNRVLRDVSALTSRFPVYGHGGRGKASERVPHADSVV